MTCIHDPAACVSEPGRGLPCEGDPKGILFRAVNATRSRHSGGVNVLMGDGAVRFVRDGVNPATWFALHSIAAGEAVADDSY